MGSVLWGTMASDLAVWAAFGVTVVVLASAIMFFVKRGVGVSRAVAWASVVALIVERVYSRCFRLAFHWRIRCCGGG
jgi:hypothetical protein